MVEELQKWSSSAALMAYFHLEGYFVLEFHFYVNNKRSKPCLGAQLSHVQTDLELMQCQFGSHSLGLILPWLNGAGLLLRTETVSKTV